MEKISSEYITQAKTLLSCHRSSLTVIQKVEKKRPTLIAQISAITTTTDSDQEILAILPASDRRIYERYLEAKEKVDIFNVAMQERLSQRNREIVEDSFKKRLSVENAAVKYGVSVPTIKRIRQKGIYAVAEEIMFREAVKSQKDKMIP